MKLKNVFAAIFAAVGLVAAIAAVILGFSSRNAGPVMLAPPEAARDRAEELLEAVCQGDYDAASGCIWGTPDLGVNREAADRVGVLLWEAFQDSMTYELVGECTAGDEGLAQNATLTCLDIRSVTANLQERSQKLLEKRVEEAKDVSEIYDDNYEYREDFVMDVLYDAAAAALKEDAREMTLELTLKLSYQNEQWWVMADEALLGAISGGILY